MYTPTVFFHILHSVCFIHAWQKSFHRFYRLCIVLSPLRHRKRCNEHVCLRMRRQSWVVHLHYEPLHSELKVLPAWCQDRHAIVRWCFCDGWKAMQLFVYIRANWLYAKCSPLKPVSTSGTVEGMLLARGARSHTGIPTCSLEVTAGQTQTNWFD